MDRKVLCSLGISGALVSLLALKRYLKRVGRATRDIEAPGPEPTVHSTPPSVLPDDTTWEFTRAGISAQGLRSQNEDSWCALPAVLVVADGVGGCPAGKVAADVTTRSVAETLGSAAKATEDDVAEAVRVAHQAVLDRGLADSSVKGMACTVDAVVLTIEGKLVGAHVGDSRVYLQGEDGVLDQITMDEAIDGALLQCVGQLDREIRPRTWTRSARDGGRLVLATDGLWDKIEGSALRDLLRTTSNLSPKDAAGTLLASALDAGGTDNVTIVVGDVVENS